MSENFESSFRRESARLVSSLTRAFGVQNLTLIEDAVQNAFIRALEIWPAKGAPPNPSAWLALVARNKLIDELRMQGKTVSEADLRFKEAPAPEKEFAEMDDAELAMLFMCCHPALPVESQLALVLRELMGLSTGEVAKGLLLTDDGAAQRLVRAKKQLAELKDPFRISSYEPRLDTVLQALYLLFNEGYAAHSGTELTRSEVCDEAILLTDRLAKTEVGNQPATHALLALMLLHSSRLPARVAADGSLALLEEQDRSIWDRQRIDLGLGELGRASKGSHITSYHCEAAIAATHATAVTFQETNWAQVLSLYDQLADLRPTPVVLLNRAIAMAFAGHIEKAMKQLDAIADSKSMKSYYLLPATRARLYELQGKADDAMREYKEALGLVENEVERNFLLKRLGELV